MSDIRVGLVLSGGGAKGAYHVGVIKALHELGAQVDMVSGASIGALSGAILAAASSLDEGAARLERLWMDLAKSSPLEANYPAYFNFLLSAGLQFRGAGLLKKLFALNELDEGVLSDSPLHAHMQQYLDIDALQHGLPLFVSVFEHQHFAVGLASGVLAELGLTESNASQFSHIQKLPINEQKQALLASAAIPLLYAPKKIDGKAYSDGAQGGWQKSQGNTPVLPLIEAGCNLIIVTHLSDGSLWSRHDFPGTTFLEIRPQVSISRDGGVSDLLGFDEKKIPSWIQQGYEDAIVCLERVIRPHKAMHQLRDSEALLQESLSDRRVDIERESAMSRLDKYTERKG